MNLPQIILVQTEIRVRDTHYFSNLNDAAIDGSLTKS